MELTFDTVELVRALDGLARRVIQALFDAFDFRLQLSDVERRQNAELAIATLEATVAQEPELSNIRHFVETPMPKVFTLPNDDELLFRETYRENLLTMESLKHMLDFLRGEHVRVVIEGVRRKWPDLGQRYENVCVHLASSAEEMHSLLEQSTERLEELLDSHDADQAIDEHGASAMSHGHARKMLGL